MARFDEGGLPMPPARGVAVLTSMDARLHPEKFLGLELGDAHVIRNAGGYRRMPYAPSSSPSDSSGSRRSWSSTTPTCGEQSDNTLKVRFSATLGEDPEVELSLA